MEKSYFIDVTTRTPLNIVFRKLLKDYDFKFVCGSNLLKGNMNGIFRQWDINVLSAKTLKGSILVGAGWWQYNDNPNLYSKLFYNTVLNKEFYHSVKDEYTKEMLKSIGINNVINTGCSTMWNFTPEFCESIRKLSLIKWFVLLLMEWIKRSMIKKY